MKRKIDIDAILAVIPGENPSGQDLRYNQIYEDIKEAKRFDDPLDQGEWKRELKTADWDKVVALCTNALSQRTKDLQVAVWLNESLIILEGFEGLAAGLKIITGLMERYWDSLYPEIEEGDLEFRAAPLEFLNEKLWSRIKEIHVTETGHSWFTWQESRQVGYESDTLNKYGDVDESKKQQRNECISEGKITAESFDSAVIQTSPVFYKTAAVNLAECLGEFLKLDKIVDERFGQDAPRLTEFGQAIEDCSQLIKRIINDKGIEVSSTSKANPEETVQTHPESVEEKEEKKTPALSLEETTSMSVRLVRGGMPSNEYLQETALLEESLGLLETGGFKKALENLLEASLRASSIREKSRYNLLTAKLCLKSDRPDLARPIAEELNSLLDELHLERWESPVWIAEVLDVLYQCLTTDEPTDDDMGRAKVLLQRICTKDVTKAIMYK